MREIILSQADITKEVDNFAGFIYVKYEKNGMFNVADRFRMFLKNLIASRTSKL